jgi:hypothetical protein
MRTFTRADWDAAQQAWAVGEFSDEWKPWRHRAAMRGMIFPPDGTRWDTWDEDGPSQRAVLVRAIRETPTLLGTAIDRSTTWHQVYAHVTGQLNDWREDVTAEERDLMRRRADAPTGREAVTSIKAILTRIGDS